MNILRPIQFHGLPDEKFMTDVDAIFWTATIFFVGPDVKMTVDVNAHFTAASTLRPARHEHDDGRWWEIYAHIKFTLAFFHSVYKCWNSEFIEASRPGMIWPFGILDVAFHSFNLQLMLIVVKLSSLTNIASHNLRKLFARSFSAANEFTMKRRASYSSQ